MINDIIIDILEGKDPTTKINNAIKLLNSDEKLDIKQDLNSLDRVDLAKKARELYEKNKLNSARLVLVELRNRY